MEHARPPAELRLEGGPAARAQAWRKWYQQFSVFLKASAVYKEPKDVQACLLVNLIGSDGYDIQSTFKFEKDENREDLDTLVKKFNEHFGTKQNTTMCRFKFFTRQQETGESIDEYVTALKILSQQCEFEHLEEGLIRDRIVCGVTDGKVRDRLLRADNLTLSSAVKICQASEMSSEEKQQIEETRTSNTKVESSSSTVDAVYARGSARPGGRRRSAPAPGERRGGGGGGAGAASAQAPAGAPRAPPPGRERLCNACGFACDRGDKCPAKRARCYQCGVYGHLKRMCARNAKNKVYQIEEDECDGCESEKDLYFVSSIDSISDSKNSKKWYETLKLYFNSNCENFKLDTGSDLNVMSIYTFERLGLKRSILALDNTKAQSFCGNYIPILGSCILKWVYKKQIHCLRFIITKNNCQSVLGKDACEELGLIKRVFTIKIEQYEDLFHGLGKLPGRYDIVIEEGAQPSVCPVRKIPIGIRDRLSKELNRMESLGVIRKVHHPTPWVNAIVVAAKKDGSMRVCLDPRPLNRVIRRAHYPLPTVTEIATKLKGACIFSKLDARSGFWMVEITDKSSDLCTFGTPFGRYQFLRLPYGINCAPEVFHSKVRQLLEDIEGVDSFVDDIIVWGSSLEEHDARLRLLLDRARQCGIKFNKEKCEFRVTRVTYLGHTFSCDGMHINSNRIRAISDMPSPSDRHSLERFLGMVNFLGKFIPNYADVASPLRSLLKKDVLWCWEDVHETAVLHLKKLICTAPVLALYTPREPVLLSVDASAAALGAVLLQAGRPVEFASTTLTDTQRRYAQIEKELLAIVFALERFHQYVFGKRDVVVETDHKPLEALFKKSLDSVPARLQRMMLRIQGYDFVVVYKPGKYMFVADTLSRAAIPELMSNKVSEELDEQSCFLLENVRFSNSKLRLVKETTEKDEECCVLKRYIMNDWPDCKHNVHEKLRELWSYRESFECVDGIIFKDNLVFIPRALRAEMIRRVHDGHMGIDRCKRHAREVMFWPRMSHEIEQAVRRCATCREKAQRPQREPLLPHNIPDGPWIKLGSDIFQYRKNYFLILVDYFSNFVEVSPLKSIGSRAVITALKDQFARHGIPSELVTDNGPAYASREFSTFSKEWGFDHVTTSPNYPQSNGRSERSVQTIKNILMKSVESGTDFYLGLLNYRATPRDGISSPAELLMGRRVATRLPAHDTKLRPYHDASADYARMCRNQIENKKRYDCHARSLPELRSGDRAIMLDDTKRRYVEVQSQSKQPRSYFVTDSAGRRYRRNRRHLVKVDSITPDLTELSDTANDTEVSSPVAHGDSQIGKISLDPEVDSEWCDASGEETFATIYSEDTVYSEDSVMATRSVESRAAALQARDKIKKIFE